MRPVSIFTILPVVSHIFVVFFTALFIECLFKVPWFVFMTLYFTIFSHFSLFIFQSSFFFGSFDQIAIFESPLIRSKTGVSRRQLIPKWVRKIVYLKSKLREVIHRLIIRWISMSLPDHLILSWSCHLNKERVNPLTKDPSLLHLRVRIGKSLTINFARALTIPTSLFKIDFTSFFQSQVTNCHYSNVLNIHLSKDKIIHIRTHSLYNIMLWKHFTIILCNM